jgi:hypothetical protein
VDDFAAVMYACETVFNAFSGGDYGIGRLSRLYTAHTKFGIGLANSYVTGQLKERSVGM